MRKLAAYLLNIILLFLVFVPNDGSSNHESDVRTQISKWSVDDVFAWLQSSELENAIGLDILKKHIVDGEVLLHLIDLRKEVSIYFAQILFSRFRGRV